MFVSRQQYTQLCKVVELANEASNCEDYSDFVCLTESMNLPNLGRLMKSNQSDDSSEAEVIDSSDEEDEKPKNKRGEHWFR